MHILEITAVLILSHAAAALLGVIFAKRARAALKTENDELRAAAGREVVKVISKL